MIRSPKYLFLQLLRFGFCLHGQKISTLVKFEEELIMPNGDIYETKALINHWGDSLKAGHFVAYSKNELGQWWFLNDSSATLSSLEEANTQDNYVLLLERKFYAQEAPSHVAESVALIEGENKECPEPCVAKYY